LDVTPPHAITGKHATVGVSGMQMMPVRSDRVAIGGNGPTAGLGETGRSTQNEPSDHPRAWRPHPMTTAPDSTRRALLGATLAALAGCRASPPSDPPLTAGASVLAFGDSLVFGTGADPESAWPARLARASGWRVTNAGRPGATTETGVQTLDGALAEVSPKAVLLGLGGNDFLRGLDPSRTEANLVDLVTRCKAGGARVLLIAVPRPSVFAAAARSLSDHPVFETVGKRSDTPVLAGAWSDVLSTPSLRADPIHANSQGYERFTTLLLARLGALGWLARRAR
jgi:acyl-CoA thioesterase I